MKKLLLLTVLLGIFIVPVSAQTLHWSTFIDTSTTFSSPRPVQLNGDNVLDIVIGGGLDGSAEARGVVAIDGATGGMLWNFPTDEEMFGSAQFRDINGDGVDDVFIGGRYAEFYAIDGATGNMIWEFFSPPPTEAVDSGWFNFYSPQFIPDQNSDGYEDILVANGGNHALPIFDTLREPGMLMVLDAVTGNVLAKDTMPDGEETYCSPVVVDIYGLGILEIVFGSGGENDGGNLYKVALSDLMLNDISGAQVLATDPNKGYIAPVSITDLNADGRKDIICQAYDGTVTAIDGGSLTPLWTVPNPGTESSSAPTIGDFIGDVSPDVFVVLAKGSAPSFFDYYQVMIDGATGNVEWKDSIGALHFSSANAVDLDLNGRDEVIVSLNNHTGTHFEHELMSIDFQNNIVSSMYLPQAGVNLGSTPLIEDLDSNGLLDIVYAFRADSVNPMGPNGFVINRLEDAFTIPGSGIAWGSYMGTDFDGHYAFDGFVCGTLNPGIAGTQPSCNHEADGFAVSVPTGGIAPYNFLWSDGSISDTLSGVPAGTYEVLVVDSAGCYKSGSVTIQDPKIITFGGIGTLQCEGDSNSMATVNSSGCPCMFSGCLFDWSTGDSTKTATGMGPGYHYVTITHTDGCVTYDSVYVNPPAPVLDSVDVIDATCATDPTGNGSIVLYLNDEVNTNILWDNASTSSALTGLSDGTYSVQLTDAIRGCVEADTFQINMPDSLVVVPSSTGLLCFGDSNGTASAVVSGGVPSYSYLWSSGETTSSLSGMTGGAYTLSVIDSLGCTNVQAILINEPGQLTTSFTTVDDSTGTCDGIAVAIPMGGTGSHSFVWNPTGSTSQILSGLCAGNYSVTITDANGCSVVDSVSIFSLVSIEDVAGQVKMNLYPNPAKSFVNVSSPYEERTQLDIYNVLGEIVLTKALVKGVNTLDIASLRPGSYIARLNGSIQQFIID